MYLQSVHIYPIKSLHEATVDGEHPLELHVARTGLMAYGVRDRQWLLDYEGHYVSQRGWEPGRQKTAFRGDSTLACVKVDIRPDHIVVDAPGIRGGRLELDSQDTSGQYGTTMIHGRELAVVDSGDAAAAFFTNYLGRPVRLKMADDRELRMVDDLYRRDHSSNTVAAADGMPIVLANQASLDALLTRAGMPPGSVGMNRFRPNLTAWLSDAFIEDRIRRLQIGEFIADIAKPNKRCPITNINQESGVVDGLAGRILGPRCGENGVPGSAPNRGFYFAQNLNHQWPNPYEVVIAEGMRIKGLEVSDAPNVLTRQAMSEIM